MKAGNRLVHKAPGQSLAFELALPLIVITNSSVGVLPGINVDFDFDN